MPISNSCWNPAPLLCWIPSCLFTFSTDWFRLCWEARASEHSARMVAMKGATENAKNIIGGLTLDYNKARQTQITNELLEITTAMRAME